MIDSMGKTLYCVYNEETGYWEERPTPFTTVEYETEEDFKFVEDAVKKQIEKEPVIETMQGMNVRKCPECSRVLFSDRYCGDCGQLIKQE